MAHVSHTQSPDQEINRLLGMVVDAENIFTSMNREEDVDTKHIYYYLYKVCQSICRDGFSLIRFPNRLQLLRKCILLKTRPIIEGSLGQPPFEHPSINQAVTNFVLYKFVNFPGQELQTYFDLAKMFLHCMNRWDFESPNSRKAAMGAEEGDVYKKNYIRWLVFCHVPAFCDSLPHYETTQVFGRALLRAVFRYVRRQLLDQCHLERDRMPYERRVIVLTHFPKFLSFLEEEIYKDRSPIWDPEFKQAPPAHLQSLIEKNRAKSK